MSAAIHQRANHFERVSADLAAAHGEAMANTAAAHQDAADVARAALAVAAKARPAAPGAPDADKRSTSATARRAAQTIALITEFSAGEMTADEVSSFLGFSPSGSRKYIKVLRDAGVIELARYVDGTATYLGRAVFRLAPSPELVSAFILELSAPRLVKPAPPAAPGHHIHILADDIHYSVRAWRGPVVRDPLVAALFGPAVAEARA